MKLDSLDKKIIICGNIINGRRIVERLSLRESLINVEITTLRSYIKNIMASKNISLISDKESAYILYNLIMKNDYGFDKDIFTVGAVLKLLEVLNDYRFNNLKTYNSILKADYSLLLKDYEEYLKKNYLADYIYALSLINNYKDKSKCIVLDDFSLRQLEFDTVKHIFSSYEVLNVDLCEPQFKSFYNSYGEYNEVLNIIKVIKEDTLPLNEIEVVYTNDIYENFIRGAFDSNRIKYSMKSVHAKSTNLVSFMMDIIEYVKSDFKYELIEKVLSNQGLDDIYLSEYYDTLKKDEFVVGFGKDRTKLFLDLIKDDETKINFYNFMFDLLSIYDDEIKYNLLIELCKKYIKSNNEIKVLEPKLNNLSYIFKYTNSLDVLKEELESIRYSEKDINDGIVVSSLNKSFSNRKHLFILGLSQTYLTKYDTENPFIIDPNNYKLEMPNDLNIHLLEYLKKEVIESLDYYIYHSDSYIYLSYASFDKVNFRPSSASVYYLNLLNKDEIKINEYKSYDKNVRFNKFDFPNVENIEDDLDNGDIKEEIESPNHEDDIDNNYVKPKTYKKLPPLFTFSPTAIKTLFDCPIRYYYQYLAKIPNIQFPRLNEYEWLESNTKGTFFHRIMELYSKECLKEENYIDHLDEDKFNDSFNIALEEAIKISVIKNETIYDREVKEIKDLSKKYIEYILLNEFNNQKYRVLGCEYNLQNANCFYNGKGFSITFNGYIDRVDGYLDNDTLHLRIIDYKTGKPDDSKDKIKYYQHVIYPYVLLNSKTKLFNLDYKNVVVDEFNYAYPFYLGKKDDKHNSLPETEIETKIFNKIETVIGPFLRKEIDSISNIEKEFDEIMEKKEVTKYSSGNCTYCTYKDTCIKRVKEGDYEWVIKKK